MCARCTILLHLVLITLLVCVCHCIRTMFRVLGVYNFVISIEISENHLPIQCKDSTSFWCEKSYYLRYLPSLWYFKTLISTYPFLLIYVIDYMVVDLVVEPSSTFIEFKIMIVLYRWKLNCNWCRNFGKVFKQC